MLIYVECSGERIFVEPFYRWTCSPRIQIGPDYGGVQWQTNLGDTNSETCQYRASAAIVTRLTNENNLIFLIMAKVLQ